MQNRFAPVASPIASQLADFGRFCLQCQVPVVVTLHHDKPEGTTELIKFWGEDIRIKKGSSDWQLLPEIEPLRKEEEVIILDDKVAYDAFKSTDLDDILRKRGIDQVIITGTVTNLCCETTARSAMVRDFQVFFVEDLNAADSPEHQKATVTKLSFGFATIIKEDEALSALSK